MKKTVSFVSGDKISNDTDYRDNLPVNISAVPKPIFGIAGYMLQDYGLTQYGTGSGVDRGGIWNERFNSHFRLSGNDFIEVSADGVSTVLGQILGSDTASFPYSFETQGIVANNQFFLYDPIKGFREVLDTDLGNPIDGVWIDGYYFFTDGEFLFHTDIDSEESIDALQYATAEFSPDITYGVAKTQDNKVMAFGRYSIEYFVNQATDNFAFLRLPSRAITAGIVGTHAKTELSGLWFILGGRKGEGIAVHGVSVGSSQKVSSRAVDIVIGNYTEDELRGAVLESRSEDNQDYLVVHLPNDVLEFNATAVSKVGIDSAWTIKKTGTGDVSWRSIAWRAKHGIFEPRLGKWVFGDKIDSRLGILDETVGTQYGEIAEWLLFTPFIYLESMSIDEFSVEVVAGHTFEPDASVALSLTYDGITYSKEYFVEYGQSLEYRNRFKVRTLGYVSNWVGIKMRGATRSRMAFSKAELDFG